MTLHHVAAASAAALLATLVWAAAPNPAQAASERLARYTVELRIDGREQWSQGGDSERTTISQRLRLVTTVRTDGQLAEVNTKDPEHARQAMARSAQVHAAVHRAQAPAAPMPPGARPGGMPGAMPGAMTQPQMMAQVMQMQARCQGDMTCLQRAAAEMAAAQVAPSDAGAQARMTAYGEAYRRCESEHARDKRRREACIAALEQRHGTATADDDGDPRYLNYFGFEGCHSEMTASIDDRIEGRYADVQGTVPYAVSRRAQHQANAVERSLLCSQHAFVLDTRTGRLWGDGLLTTDVRGQVNRRERGRDQVSDTSLSLRPEAVLWAMQQLRQSPKSGSARITLPLDGARTRGAAAGGRHEGTVDVELSWRFDEL